MLGDLDVVQEEEDEKVGWHVEPRKSFEEVVKMKAEYDGQDEVEDEGV